MTLRPGNLFTCSGHTLRRPPMIVSFSIRIEHDPINVMACNYPARDASCLRDASSVSAYSEYQMDDLRHHHGSLLSVANLLVCRPRGLSCLYAGSPPLSLQNEGLESALGRLERCRNGISKR